MRKSLLKIYRTDYLILMISMILCCFWFLFAFHQPSTGQNSPGQDRAELQEIQNNQVKSFFPQNKNIICKTMFILTFQLAQTKLMTCKKIVYFHLPTDMMVICRRQKHSNWQPRPISWSTRKIIFKLQTFQTEQQYFQFAKSGTLQIDPHHPPPTNQW